MKEKTKKTSILPLHDYVLVKQIPAPEEVSKAAYFEEKGDTEISYGEVVLPGQYGKISQNPASQMEWQIFEQRIKAGDTILFSALRGMPIRINGEELLIIKYDWIVAIVSNS